MKRFNSLTPLLGLLLAGCSSPPEPTKVEWDKPVTAVNASFPGWHENTTVVRSPLASGPWAQTLTDFRYDGNYPSEVWYAVTHASRIMVSAPDASRYFTARDWLIRHGATGLMVYQPKTRCLTCTSTDIYFSR
ncbi:hypothetical protein NG99_24405 [Erwinia typographi]|uniref:Cag pathogenicity island protein Cag12 n=1 Tax=Erwinia typographi TaxID=371042 RepID=A0A0A3YNY1_9GAMM|nr:cag pathogenicity island Cag12 family protein [Erwinia typographi]KGT87021.1 hypothetical protein NG99_24405 [Erwinia typographi]